MDRQGIRRMRRGAGGPPRQAALAPVGRGGARAGGGGRGGARAGHGRGGGRGGHGGGGRGGRGRGGGRGQLQGQMRARPPVPPHMDDWLKRAKFGNPNGLNFQQLESEVDGCLTNNPRIDQQELDTFPLPRHQLNQGQDIVPLLMEASDNCRKMSLSRKMLLRMYLNGDFTSIGAQYWRKILAQLEVELDGTYYELRRVNARHRPMPEIFLTRPTLLPKDS